MRPPLLVEHSRAPEPASLDDVFFTGPEGSRVASRVRERISVTVPIPEKWATLRTAAPDGPRPRSDLRIYLAPFSGPTAHLPVYNLDEQ